MYNKLIMSDIDNKTKKSFQETMTIEERKAHSLAIKNKYPDRIPIIMQRSKDDRILGDLDKIKYLVPGNLTTSEFMKILRRRLNVNSSTSIYLFNPDYKILLSGTNTIDYLYDKYKNQDNFLYIEYCGENTFG